MSFTYFLTKKVNALDEVCKAPEKNKFIPEVRCCYGGSFTSYVLTGSNNILHKNLNIVHHYSWKMIWCGKHIRWFLVRLFCCLKFFFLCEGLTELFLLNVLSLSGFGGKENGNKNIIFSQIARHIQYFWKQKTN